MIIEFSDYLIICDLPMYSFYREDIRTPGTVPQSQGLLGIFVSFMISVYQCFWFTAIEKILKLQTSNLQSIIYEVGMIFT